MTSPVVNYSGANGSIPTFSLWVYRDGSSTAGDSLTILVNTTNTLAGAVRIGGVARSRFFVLPVNEPANGWYNYTFNVPVTFNTDTNYILLNGTAHGGGHIYIDDLQWTEYAVACSGTPTAGNAVANDTLFCGGAGNTTLSLTGSGLQTGGLTFQWQLSSSATGPWTDFGSNASSINSGTISSDTYFRCYVTCATGLTTDTSSIALVQVSPNPPPVITIPQGTLIDYCPGSTPLVLTATGAVTYTWNPNIAINSTGDSAWASPSATTTYIVDGTDSAGCKGSASVTVNVIAAPIVNAFVNNDTICSGQSVNLNSFIQGGSFNHTFIWQPGSLLGQSQTVTPLTNTTYIVGATSNLTGCTGYDSVSVIVFPSANAGFTYIVNNLTYTFTDTSSGPVVSWLWNFGDGNTDTIQNPVHTYSANGTYTITLTVTTGNCTSTYTQTITVLSVANIQFNGMPVIVKPNPVSEKSVVTFSSRTSSTVITLSDFSGRLIGQKHIEFNAGLVSTELDMSAVAQGVYFLQITSGNETVFVRIVKE